MATSRAAACYEPWRRGGVQALDLEVIDVVEAGDLAIEIGRTTLTIQSPGAEPVIESGKSVVVWR